MIQKLLLLCAVFTICFSTASGVQVSNGPSLASSTRKITKKRTASIVAQSHRDESKNNRNSKLSIIAMSGKGILTNIASRLPFRKKIVPAIAKIIGPPPSSLTKINILMFMFYTTLGAAMPFIPLYYRHIGLSNNQVGLLGAITPAVTFLASPAWGALADSTGWHKHIMLLTFTGSVIVRSALALATKQTNILWLYAIVASSAVLNAPVKPLMDSAVMSMLSDKSDYGRSRLYGQIGFGLGSYVVGPLIAKDIKMIFLMQLLFAVPTSILMAGFEPTQTEKKKDKIDVWAAVNHMVSDTRVIVFFSMVFLIGVSSGIVENFAYMRIQEVITVGANSGNVLGVCRLLSSVAGGPMFWLSGAISKQIGVNGVLTWSFCSYVLRFIIYASIKNPWQAIPAEILRGTTFAVFWAGSTYFVYTVSPSGLTATMLSILNGVYGGLGQSVGALVGGTMSKHYGISKSFYMCGAVDFVALSLFVLYQLRLSVLSRPPRSEVPAVLKTQMLKIADAKKSELKAAAREAKKEVKKEAMREVKEVKKVVKGSVQQLKRGVEDAKTAAASKAEQLKKDLDAKKK